MSSNKNIKTIFILNYIILFSGIAFSLYYSHDLFIKLREKSANQNLLAINQLTAKTVNTQLQYVSDSVKSIGESYKKLYAKKYEYINDKSIYNHKFLKNDKITFYHDNVDKQEYIFQSNHASMILSNLNQDPKSVARELNLFHQITPALESIYNSFNFSWVYITTMNDFMLIYPYVPYSDASDIYKPTQLHFYKAANFKDKKVGWEEPYYDIAGAGVLVTASYPIYDDNEKLLGVASHDITVDKIAVSVLKETLLYKGSISFLLSKDGKVISSTALNYMNELEDQVKDEYRGNFYYRTVENGAKEGLNNIITSKYDYLNQLGDEIISTFKYSKDSKTRLWKSSVPFFNDKLLFVSEVPSTKWILVSYVPKQSIFDETKSIFYQTLLILSLFITALFIISGVLTMNHLIKPLDIINKASERFGDGFTDVKVQYSGQNLIKTLFETFNNMVEKVKFNQQLLEKKVDERTNKLQKEINRRKKVEKELRLISRTDALTGIWNRGYFFEMMERELNRAERFNTNITFLMIDIDFFKNINDTFGHSTGDEAIKHIVKIINTHIRKENLFGRLGGEEFGIILIETKEFDIPLHVAERIRKSVEENPLILKNKPIPITISIGMAKLTSSDNVSTLYNRGDKALYLAKENGRNRIEEIKI